MAFTTLMVISAVTTAISAYSKWKAGNAEKDAGEAQQRAAEGQADLTDYNAEVARFQAVDATKRGEIDANRFRQRTRVLVGEQRAGFASGNVDVGYGSAVDVQADATFLGELDALTIRSNAAREAWGFRVEADDLTMQATLTRREGVNMAAAGRQRQSAMRWEAGGTIIGGTQSMLQMGYGWNRSRKED